MKMKILAFTDMHGSLSALKKIKEKAKNCDIVVCGGDFTIFEQGMEKFMSDFDKLKKKVLIIHGNHEEEELIDAYCKIHKNLIPLHNNHFVKDDILFLGYGGGGFSLRDKEFEKRSKNFVKLMKKYKDKAVVLIIHAPPYGKLDLVCENHCGNKSFTEFIKKNKIDLVICGHLHENNNQQNKIGVSNIINPGPAGRVIKI